MNDHPRPDRPTLTALLPVMVLAVGLHGCAKDDDPAPDPGPPAPAATVTLRLEHHVDGVPLLFDTVLYANEAGHAYAVSHLEYYISGIKLLTADTGDVGPAIPGAFLINAEQGTTFDLGALAPGGYTGVELRLGLTPDLNITGALPNTIANVNMAWPDGMGGGYHFMKFEGHFLNGATPTGYAMHLGRNENLPTCIATADLQLDGSAQTLVLRFNLNEVFRTPHTYDLVSGSYSMGSMMLMGLLRDNCADAFTATLEP